MRLPLVESFEIVRRLDRGGRRAPVVENLATKADLDTAVTEITGTLPALEMDGRLRPRLCRRDCLSRVFG